MPGHRLLTVALVWLGMVSCGCRLPTRGPLSPATTKSREYSQQGITALEQGRWESAEKSLAKAVEICPEDAEARRHHAEALWSLGRRPDAIAEIEKAVELAPQDAALRVRIGQMRLATRQLSKAQAEVDAALDMEPQRADAWAMRARVRRAAGHTAEALADYHRALGFAPDDRELLLETAEIYRQLNEPEKALALLHRLVDTYGPEEEPSGVIYLEGLAYAALGRYDEAAERYTAALSRGQPTPELLYQLAVARSRIGQPYEALAAAEAALRMQPDNEPARRLIEQLGQRQPPDGPLRR
jgi:tetratricopeptide (TPR) repeat protein